MVYLKNCPEVTKRVVPEPEASEPGEPDRGVSAQAQAAPRVRVLRPHRAARAGETSCGQYQCQGSQLRYYYIRPPSPRP